MKIIFTLLLFILQPLLLNAQYFDLREGNNKYLAGDYDEAKRRYDKIIAESEKFEDKKEAIFNSGNALYRMNKFDDAEADYRKIAENNTLAPSLRADALYNIGNSYFTRAKDLQGEQKEAMLKNAIKHYKESLKLNPNDLQAKQNLELAKALLKQEEDKKQGNNKNDKQDQDKNQNDKNQNQDDKQNDKNNQDQQNNKDKQENQQNQNQQNQNNQDNQNKPKDQQQEQQGKQGGAQISKADAEKLLDALKQDEKQMLKKYLMKKSNQTKYEKDW
ncbi:MAG: tetratricopeptide repeat protein [Chloroherpetonaceae bacterium]